jgi:F-type H+-transporting ATPase subunit delta
MPGTSRQDLPIMAEHIATPPFDAGRQYLGSVYAKALFGAAEKAGETADVLEQLGALVDDVFPQLPKLEAALGSARVPLDGKERMLLGALGQGASQVLLNGLRVMARNGRLDCLRETLGFLRQLDNAARGRVEVELRTAAPVSNQLLEKVRQRLTAMLGSEVLLTARVQPELVGGLVVRVGDKLYDGSIASRLEQVRTHALETTAAAVRGALDRFATA